MHAFAPIPATERWPQCSIRIGDQPKSYAGLPLRPKKWVERLATQAAFNAAIVATGCASAYELEQRFSPNRPDPGQSATAWADQRERVWDRWSGGRSTIAGLLRRGSSTATVRLDAVRRVSRLVDEVLAMPLWRLLDPQPLTTIELIPESDEVARFAAGFTNADADTSPRGFALDAQFLLNGLCSLKVRYSAMSGLWLRMRTSNDVRDLVAYVHHYLCWLWFRPILESDPVFGPLASSLYDYTDYHFGQLALLPNQPSVVTEASLLLMFSYMRPCVLGPVGTIGISLSQFERLLAPTRHRNRWFLEQARPIVELRDRTRSPSVSSDPCSSRIQAGLAGDSIVETGRRSSPPCASKRAVSRARLPQAERVFRSSQA